jgi:hypothetical protein
MAINVADNFSYKGEKPLDARIKYATISDMVSVPASDLYDGCLAYVVSEKTNYQYDSSNTSDPTTGKWRELETGGGGTTYTAGDGIDITNDEISVDEMPQTDMEEILTPLPSVMSRRMKYSTEEQVVGEWIDGKPIYQKTVSDTFPNTTAGTYNAKNIATILNVDNVVSIAGWFKTALNTFVTLPWTSATGYISKATFEKPQNAVFLQTNASDMSTIVAYITLQYTKITD